MTSGGNSYALQLFNILDNCMNSIHKLRKNNTATWYGSSWKALIIDGHFNLKHFIL